MSFPFWTVRPRFVMTAKSLVRVIGFLLLLGSIAAGRAAPLAGVIRAREFMMEEKFSEAAALLKSPSESSDPDALMLLGILHATGAGVLYDNSLAVSYWRKAALAGHRDAAQLQLGGGVNAFAREWWQTKIAAMEAPKVTAPENMVETGGRSWTVNRKVARKWIARMAEAGDAVGLYNSYQAAKIGFGLSDSSKAKVRLLLERAVQLEFPAAMVELSSEFEQRFPFRASMSLGFPKDPARAAELMRRAADLGDAQAQLLWGHWLKSKKTNPPDPTTAVSYYRKASDQGDGHAAYFLYEAYFRGEGVERDDVKAADFLRLAALRGNDLAVSGYARDLFHGRGMPQDQAAAVVMMEAGLVCDLVPNADLMVLVAFAYANGLGVKQDLGKSVWWCDWAIERGSNSAVELRDKITAYLSKSKEPATEPAQRL